MAQPILSQNHLLGDSTYDLSADFFTGYASIKVDVGYCLMVSNFGDAVGVAVLQISPNADDNANTPLWYDLTGTELAVDGTSNTLVWNVERAMYPWIRISYTSTSGTGVMVPLISSKSN